MILMNGRYVDLERVVANIQSFLAENNTTNALVVLRPQRLTDSRRSDW